MVAEKLPAAIGHVTRKFDVSMRKGGEREREKTAHEESISLISHVHLFSPSLFLLGMTRLRRTFLLYNTTGTYTACRTPCCSPQLPPPLPSLPLPSPPPALSPHSTVVVQQQQQKDQLEGLHHCHQVQRRHRKRRRRSSSSRRRNTKRSSSSSSSTTTPSFLLTSANQCNSSSCSNLFTAVVV